MGIGIMYHRGVLMIYEPHHFERGQGLAEYGLIIVMVGILVFLVLYLMGPAVGNMFSNVVNML
jgi:pilus assembly protein Flp/PilA